jgi:hypothetical protein
MVKLPFQTIEDFALYLIRMAAAGDSEYYFKLYFNYLAECGWTDQEFNQELLRQIDDSWSLDINSLH